MIQSNVLTICCFLFLFFSSFIKAAEGYDGALPPSSEDIDKVLASQRTCMDDKKVLRTALENLTILTPKVSKGAQEDGNFSIMLNGNFHTQISYSSYLWDALVAGAEKFKELQWVVLPQQQGKVVTEKKWNEEYSKIKTDCYDKRGSCEDQISKKISLAITKKSSAGIIKSSNMTVNCLRESDANLLIALIDNKYTYNADLKKWEDPKSTSNSEGAKSPKTTK